MAARTPALWVVLAIGGGLTSGCRKEQSVEATVTPVPPVAPQVVSFMSGTLTLQGVLYKPAGGGPFPAVLFNHDSSPGMIGDEVLQALGPHFVSRGWVFFAPWRRGQGLSENLGTYILHEIEAAWHKDGVAAAAAVLVRRHETDQLDDQLAGLTWLRTAAFVAPGRIAVAGSSYGGIQTVLGVESA